MPVTPPKPQVSRAVPLACVALVLVVLAVYANSLAGPFIFDDLASIPQNPSLRSLRSAFLPPPGGLTVSGRPVLNASFALNWLACGAGVASFHGVNLALHALAGLALFGIVRRTLLGLGRAGEDAAWPAFLVALLWLVHPLQTESVTYMVQRAESLMGLFYLLTLYAFIRGATAERGTGWFVVAAVSCFLGVGTKEVIASAPLIVLLYDRTFVAGGFSAAWRKRRWVHLSLVATWIPLAALVIQGGGRGNTVGQGTGVGFWKYLATQPQALCHYLWLTVWPDPLILDYGKRWVASPWDLVPYLLVVLLLAAATAWALVRRPALGFLGVVFFAILAPSSLASSGRQTLAEHRMYLALAPVLVLCVLLLERRLGRAARWLAAAAALALACVTVGRNWDYRTDLGIWADTVAKRPGNAYAQNNYANLLSQAGHPDLALDHLEAALAIDPGYTDAAYNAGVAAMKLERPAEAVDRFEQALRYNPRMADAETQLGAALEAVGRPQEATRHYENALTINPSYSDARNHLGLALAAGGHPQEAVAQLEQAVASDPSNPDYRDNLGNAYRAAGQATRAIGQYEAALRLDPRSAAGHNNLGNAYREMGRLSEALAQYDAAAAAQPDSALIHSNRGITLLMLGRVAEAISAFQTALRHDPSLAQVHVNLAIALEKAGRDADAQAEIEIAQRLGAPPPSDR